VPRPVPLMQTTQPPLRRPGLPWPVPAQRPVMVRVDIGIKPAWDVEVGVFDEGESGGWDLDEVC
jgi:hypothetical protein